MISKIELFDEAGKSLGVYALSKIEPEISQSESDPLYISKYVSYNEVVHSNTAIIEGLANTPNDQQLERIKILCRKVFDPAREAMGHPIAVNSMYRSTALNKAIGGSKTSQHMANNGAAVDMDNRYGGFKLSELFHWIKDNLQFDQLIWEFGTDKEPEWIHVSYNEGKNRGEILKASKKSGKTVYSKF